MNAYGEAQNARENAVAKVRLNGPIGGDHRFVNQSNLNSVLFRPISGAASACSPVFTSGCLGQFAMAAPGSKRWYFSEEKFTNSPSRRLNITADKEESYRQQAANFIQDMGQRLQV